MKMCELVGRKLKPKPLRCHFDENPHLVLPGRFAIHSDWVIVGIAAPTWAS